MEELQNDLPSQIKAVATFVPTISSPSTPFSDEVYIIDVSPDHRAQKRVGNFICQGEKFSEYGGENDVSAPDSDEAIDDDNADEYDINNFLKRKVKNRSKKRSEKVDVLRKSDSVYCTVEEKLLVKDPSLSSFIDKCVKRVQKEQLIHARNAFKQDYIKITPVGGMDEVDSGGRPKAFGQQYHGKYTQWYHDLYYKVMNYRIIRFIFWSFYYVLSIYKIMRNDKYMVKDIEIDQSVDPAEDLYINDTQLPPELPNQFQETEHKYREESRFKTWIKIVKDCAFSGLFISIIILIAVYETVGVFHYMIYNRYNIDPSLIDWGMAFQLVNFLVAFSFTYQINELQLEYDTDVKRAYSIFKIHGQLSKRLDIAFCAYVDTNGLGDKEKMEKVDKRRKLIYKKVLECFVQLDHMTKTIISVFHEAEKASTFTHNNNDFIPLALPNYNSHLRQFRVNLAELLRLEPDILTSTEQQMLYQIIEEELLVLIHQLSYHIEYHKNKLVSFGILFVINVYFITFLPPQIYDKDAPYFLFAAYPFSMLVYQYPRLFFNFVGRPFQNIFSQTQPNNFGRWENDGRHSIATSVVTVLNRLAKRHEKLIHVDREQTVH